MSAAGPRTAASASATNSSDRETAATRGVARVCTLDAASASGPTSSCLRPWSREQPLGRNASTARNTRCPARTAAGRVDLGPDGLRHAQDDAADQRAPERAQPPMITASKAKISRAGPSEGAKWCGCPGTRHRWRPCPGRWPWPSVDMRGRRCPRCGPLRLSEVARKARPSAVRLEISCSADQDGRPPSPSVSSGSQPMAICRSMRMLAVSMAPASSRASRP